ncbi:hypothetical protein C8Q78DRAFT_1064249 [Trametes maxima]|nr:hypothetical protein C8Q78DRAFT_1064249 [Trametes maxima]
MHVYDATQSKFWKILSETNSWVISATVLFIYDWIIAFDRELPLVWRRRIGLPGILYVIGRTVGPLGIVVNLAGLPTLNDQSCEITMRIGKMLSLFPYLFWASLSGFRFHALSGGHKLLTSAVVCLGIVPICLNVYVNVSSEVINYPPPLGCIAAFRFPGNAERAVRIITALSRGSVALAECAVVVVTWKATSVFRRGDIFESRPSLRQVLFRSGLITFMASLVLNLLSLVLIQMGADVARETQFVAHWRDA